MPLLHRNPKIDSLGIQVQIFRNFSTMDSDQFMSGCLADTFVAVWLIHFFREGGGGGKLPSCGGPEELR
jgi:hypothetical protein